MSLQPELRSRIESLLAQHRVVLFMKGTRQQPRCGFSASALAAIGEVTDEFHDVDVLADAEIREGIKAYGQWPTIPQLYVAGELIGGADIIQEMVNSGALCRTLGLPEPDRKPTDISISDAAAEQIRAALEQAEGGVLHLSIDPMFRAELALREAQGHEIIAQSQGIQIHLDLGSARRAHGLSIDWVETPQGSGLALRNPNAPPPVNAMSVQELKLALANDSLRLIDVRPAQARAFASIAGAEALEGHESQWQQLPRDTPLAFLCHHGISSRQVAEQFRALGFRRVFNIEGGIDAWSREIDPSVSRY